MMQRQQGLSRAASCLEAPNRPAASAGRTRSVGAGTALALSMGAFAIVAFCAAASADPLQIAQTSTTTSPLGAALTVTEIRECLCMDQQMNSMREEISMRQDLLNERQQELANVDQQVKTQRAALAPDDTVGQQVLKDLLAQQQNLRTLLQNDLRPAYNGQVNRLNAIVNTYNGQCVNRPRYAVDLKMAQQDLQCPKP
ncbi:MAG: hypothetical protein ABWY00_01370 [Dongiaceae bacterium]